MEQLYDFRSKLGLIQKNRPKNDQESQNALDGISVLTPMMDQDRIQKAAAVIGVHDLKGGATGGAAEKLIQHLMKTDRAQYDRLVDLMRYFNMQEIDLRLVSQLKACFINKDHEALP